MARGKLTEAYGVLGDAIAGIGIGEEAWVEKYKVRSSPGMVIGIRDVQDCRRLTSSRPSTDFREVIRN